MKSRVSYEMVKVSFQPNSLVWQIMFKNYHESGTVLGTMNTEVNKPHLSLPLWGLQSNTGSDGWMDERTNG